MKKGFTLAEILITIGIIGIVVAMTMPTLISNYNGKKYRIAFKKTVSVLSQVAMMNKANEGFDYSGAYGDTYGDKDKEEFLMSSMAKRYIKDISTKYIYMFPYWSDRSSAGLEKDDYEEFHYYIKRVSYISQDVFGTDIDGPYVLPDGVWVGFPSLFDQGDCHLPTGEKISNWFEIRRSDVDASGPRYCGGYIDVNGPKGPNKEVSCTTGTTSFNLDEPCTVTDASMGDVFPVLFIDSVVVPATNAARAAFLK